jgi:hypothetical protein
MESDKTLGRTITMNRSSEMRDDIKSLSDFLEMKFDESMDKLYRSYGNELLYMDGYSDALNNVRCWIGNGDYLDEQE